ncbi:hypothetical protein AA958_19285 [Streptomyces sp. CNQ-509]|nr:hypothetical protein AA958_19285 [Streptomyces sp. CNQ-509]
MRKAALLVSSIALIGGSALASTSASATATQPAPAQSKYAAQAEGAGLTTAQAAKLQNKMDRYVARTGGTQVAINKIDLNGKGVVLVPLPGQDRAREISADGDVGALYTCNYYHFCAYSGTYYTGSVIDMYYCRSYSIPWAGNGSWDNNQSTGTRARMYGSSGNLIYTTPGAHSWDAVGNWTPVFTVRPC